MTKEVLKNMKARLHGRIIHCSKLLNARIVFSTFSSLRLSLREVPELKKMMAVMCGHQRGRKAELAAAVWQQAERRVNINHGLVDAEARQDRQVSRVKSFFAAICRPCRH